MRSQARIAATGVLTFLAALLVAGAAAAFNCLVEQKIDAAMARTRGRPTAIGVPIPFGPTAASDQSAPGARFTRSRISWTPE